MREMFKLFSTVIFVVTTLFANEPVVEDVKVTEKRGLYSFSVRILHEDSGWEHYVNRYEVLDREGNILATRTLWHPHEKEQPFTRSLSNVEIKGSDMVYLRANDSVDGYSKLYEVKLP